MKSHLIAVALATVLVSSCATVKQNIDARTYLAKCKYEYAGSRSPAFSSPPGY